MVESITTTGAGKGARHLNVLRGAAHWTSFFTRVLVPLQHTIFMKHMVTGRFEQFTLRHGLQAYWAHFLGCFLTAYVFWVGWNRLQVSHKITVQLEPQGILHRV